jgi:ElaB/YqjD/DUF883 family membrane-anchored ribosome-binding protein
VTKHAEKEYRLNFYYFIRSFPMATSASREPIKNKTKDVKEALSDLSKTAQSQKEEIKDMVQEDLDHVKNVVSTIPPVVSTATSEARKSLEAQMEELKTGLNQVKMNIEASAKAEPWKTIGTAALGAFILGFITRGSR